MSFTAVGFNGLPISNEDIRQDIQKEYLDQTLTVE
jgi:ubiquitin-like-conjugating enzyme ATG3